jgi:chitinase
MGQMISQAQFDIIWIQYYNTPQCSAVNWVTANPNYTTTGIEEPSGFSFDAWERFLVGTASSNAKLYIGLPGGPGAFYLTPTEASSLIRAYYCKPNFGGIMIWEATAAENNNVGCGETYYEAVKGILVADSLDGTLDCVVPPASPPPTSSTSMCTVSSTTTSTVSSTITPTPPCTEVYVVVSGDYCYAIWTEFGITEAQLYAWNPTLDANCDLSIGQVLCVAESTSSSTTTTGVSTTTTTASTSATATACTEHYTVVSGDSCYAIWTEFGITEAQLYAYNPTLDTNCDLFIGQVLCVSESPTSTSSSLSITSTSTTTSVSSTPSACTKHYTVVSGDSCYAIWTEFGITEAQLYAFNPTLDTNCDLSIGQVLCVSESPTSTSSGTISTTSSTTSSSTSASSTATCTEYYTVVSGDYCYLIYTKFGITEAQLYAYNPSLDTNCDLSIGQVLCVSESPLSSSSSSVTSTSTSSSNSGTGTKSSTTSTSTSKTSTSSSSKSTSTSTSTSSKSTTTSSSIHITTSSTTSTSSVPATTPLICNADNCLRQLQHSSASAAAFCATYTTTINTASTGLPTSVSNCQSSYVRISSACSCLVSSSSTTTTRATSATTTTASTKTNDSSVITSSTGTTLKTSTSKSSTSSTISASFTP